MGGRLAKTAVLLGKPLFPWQRYVADVSLEIDEETGLLVYDNVTLVLPRQQGKTEFVLPLMTHRSTAFTVPQRTLYTAQTAAEARKKWEDIHVKRLLESQLKPLFDVRYRLNAEAIMWANGSFWSPGSTTAKTGGTGDTLDLGVIDEAWSRPDARTELGMRPAMLTRQNRQLWRISMVPGLSRAKGVDSKYLREQMAQGRERVEQGVTRQSAYFEWSAPRGLDPGDPATWRTCMPGLSRFGGLIEESSVESDYKTMALVDFCAEYLGWPTEDHVPRWTVIRKGVWESLWEPESQPSGSIALGVDVSPDHLRAAIASCGMRKDGDWHIELIEPGNDILSGAVGTDWLEGRMVDLCNRHDPCAVVIDPRSPAAALIIPLKNRGIEVLTPNTLEISAQAARFYVATGQPLAVAEIEDTGQRLRHIDQPDLNRAVAHARTTDSPSSGSFSWLRVGSTDITPLLAVNLAMYGYELMRPDDYDVMESVY